MAKPIRRIIPATDYYGNKLHEGDRVTFLYKSYGYMKLQDAYLCEGVVDKLPEEELYMDSGKECWYKLHDGNVAVNYGGHTKWVPCKSIILHHREETKKKKTTTKYILETGEAANAGWNTSRKTYNSFEEVMEAYEAEVEKYIKQTVKDDGMSSEDEIEYRQEIKENENSNQDAVRSMADIDYEWCVDIYDAE